jgi:thiamine pyrophosphokinase
LNKSDDKGICYIVGAGPCQRLDFSTSEKDYVIAADGGFRHLEAAGIRPDLVVGDFDTMGRVPDHDNVVRLQIMKDVTDTFAAMEKGISLGYEEFRLYGCLGGKLEHTLANLQHLAWLSDHGCRGWLLDDTQAVTALRGPACLRFAPIAVETQEKRFADASASALEHGVPLENIQGALGKISVFCHSDRAEGVTLTGMRYPLKDAVMTNGFPLGISNEFTGPEAAVCVEKGTLLVMIPKDALPRIECTSEGRW